MRDNYDFSESIQNPYFSKLKKQESVNIDEDIVSFFKVRAKETGVSYQTLINRHLSEYISGQNATTA